MTEEVYYYSKSKSEEMPVSEMSDTGKIYRQKRKLSKTLDF